MNQYRNTKIMKNEKMGRIEEMIFFRLMVVVGRNEENCEGKLR